MAHGNSRTVPLCSPSMCIMWVNWSSSSTRSKSSITIGCSWNHFSQIDRVSECFLTAKLSFLMANKTSIIYWVLLSIEASWRIFLIRSKIAFNARGATSDNFKPISLMNPTATSTESSVGFSNRSVKISKPIISWTTCWLTKWATNRQPFRQRSFWFLRNDRRKTRTRRERINSPMAGN